jgi:hypothetical protein
MRIFGIGLGKTATSSLAEGLRMLGIPAFHRARHHKRVLEGIEALETEDGRFADGRAYLDGPFFEHWRSLLRLYPAERFILTTRRDREAWITSQIVQTLYTRVCDHDPRRWVEINTAHLARTWDRHHRDVRAALAGDPRFLELDIPAGDGFDKLCPWLGLDPPAAEFPRLNTGAEKLREILAAIE